MTITKKLLIKFDGAIEGKSCSICKLEIREKQRVFQCPYCDYLFHEEHMLEWLENHEDCPVCNKIIKFDYTEKKIDNKSSYITALTSTATPNVFKNKSFQNSLNYYLFRIFGTILGVASLGISVYFLVLLAIRYELFKEEMIILGFILSSVTLLFGILFIILPNIKFQGKTMDWKNLIIFENGLLIERRKRPKLIKLFPEFIESIELDQYLGSRMQVDKINAGHSIYSVPQYIIQLRINMTNKTVFYIKSMCQFDTQEESDEMYRYLKDKIKEWYKIDVITPFQTKDK